MLKRLVNKLSALNRDEQGADMVEYILVVAAIALPLLAIVIWFWTDIKNWAIQLWQSSKGKAEAEIPD